VFVTEANTQFVRQRLGPAELGNNMSDRVVDHGPSGHRRPRRGQCAASSHAIAHLISWARACDLSDGCGPVLIPQPIATTGETALVADPRPAKMASQVTDFVDVFSGFCDRPSLG
jgi:hypothetical protein